MSKSENIKIRLGQPYVGPKSPDAKVSVLHAEGTEIEVTPEALKDLKDAKIKHSLVVEGEEAGDKAKGKKS